MSEAEKEGIVDVHLLNGMLRVHTKSGRIEPAIRFYDTEYKKHGMTPTTHSDRLLLEMLIKKKRLSRAFSLKESIEQEGRTVDLLSYGSFVEHFGNRNQLGSALLLIKECIETHGVPPGEKSLKNVRLMCRQNDLTELVGLEKMVGEEPKERSSYVSAERFDGACGVGEDGWRRSFRMVSSWSGVTEKNKKKQKE